MLFLNNNVKTGNIKYDITGVEELELEFYSTYGTVVTKMPNGNLYVGHNSLFPIEVLNQPIYLGQNHLYTYDENGNTLESINDATNMFGIEMQNSSNTDDISIFPILGASIFTSEGDNTKHRILPISLNIEEFDTSSNNGKIFLHKMKFNIPTGTKEIKLEINDLIDLSIEQLEDISIFTSISKITFTGQDIKLGKEESSSSSQEPSKSESSESSSSDSSENSSSNSSSSQSTSEEKSEPSTSIEIIVPENEELSQDSIDTTYNSNFGKQLNPPESYGGFEEEEDVKPIIQYWNNDDNK